MLVNEDNYDVFEKVSKRLMESYEINWFKTEEIKGYIEPKEMLSMIEDLLCEIDRLEEKAEKREQEIKDNYKQITPSEMYEI